MTTLLLVCASSVVLAQLSQWYGGGIRERGNKPRWDLFVLAIVVLGGMGSQFAVILAAVLLVVSRELMRDFNEYSMLMLGGLMVLMMIWRPQGLLPMTRPQLKLKNGAAKGEQA